MCRGRRYTRIVRLRDVRFFRAELKYVTVVTDYGEHLLDESLDSLENRFANRLVRLHRGYLVPRDGIHSLDLDIEGQYSARLHGCGRDGRDMVLLPVSRRRVVAIRRVMLGLPPEPPDIAAVTNDNHSGAPKAQCPTRACSQAASERART